MDTVDYEILLSEYRGLWNNRRLESEQSSENILKEAIVRDLKDENAHPRARRTLMEKYYLATKRILDSSIACESKLTLIRIHMEQAEKIQQARD
ncbi:hypothetical protein M3204_07960 [Mesobacillus subterraneus]|jgi:hypothetical protein|uniref:hypothetical protein n=1 Tax=Mesobacillus subterraneus TaxID=285983 RepID=UPI002040DC39|nr:hypothetical protein [Mesobacillus subterraneus]MCM3664334.1 hypothetical protein [Mesobacillus subterraneus]MCM3682361.1 hypothetical protein [Mesobacillus subterraneus]